MQAKMDLVTSSLIAAEIDQEDIVLNRSDNIDLLDNCRNAMEGSVIIFDEDSQEEEITQAVIGPDSKGILNKDSEDANNFITLHASPENLKQETVEEGISETNMNTTQSSTVIKNEEVEVDSDDDETIATFVTSTGQQLALYAVEDSDEIFAVALYDETGAPPTNFHFLLKADVERLIGEGAVKTVKKPQCQQQKAEVPVQKKQEIKQEKVPELKFKQEKLVISQTKAESVKVAEPQIPKVQEIKNRKPEQAKPVIHKNYSIANRNINRNINITKKPMPTPSNTSANTTKIVSNVSDVKSDIKKETSIAYVLSSDNESYIIENAQDLDSDAEIIEQSTVQYILCDGDPSDSELTFDELQASLQSFKRNKTTTVNKTKMLQSPNVEIKKEPAVKYYSIPKSTPKPTHLVIERKESPIIHCTYKSPKKSRTTNNLLQTHRKIKQEIEDSSYSDFSLFEDGHNSSDDVPNTTKENTSVTEKSMTAAKVKRSRKQQLTVVNRTDSEIIIQPASAYSEEEDEPIIVRKRGRRRKKLLADPDYNPRKSPKKTKRSSRLVEVIEIDVDENERSIDMSLEENKGKGSSDKENNVISVDDSEEDEKNSTATKSKFSKPLMQCSHCLKNFKKRKALERHLQACPKSPANIQKLEERKVKSVGKVKKFKCKSCDETFDIAVALARHVRVVHSPRKRGSLAKYSWSRDDDSDSSDMDDSIEESSPEPEHEPRKRGRPPKRSISKDESLDVDNRTKLENSETGVRATEPRKRGRPPGKKNVLKEKTAASDAKLFKEIPMEPRKRGRPRKRSLSKDRSISSELEEKTENTSIINIPKKRGRPSKRNLSKDGKSDTPEPEVKNENVVEPLSETKKEIESRKRSLSKDGRSLSPEMKGENNEKSLDSKANVDDSVAIEEEKKKEGSIEPELESRKKRRISKDDSSKSDTSTPKEIEHIQEPLNESRRRGRPSKEKSVKSEELDVSENKSNIENLPLESHQKEDTSSNDKISKEDKPTNIDEQNPTEPSLETRKRGRPSKDKSLKDAGTSILDEEKVSENLKKPLLESEKDDSSNNDKSSKDDEANSVEVGDKIKGSTELSTEPRKRGRPSKDKIVKDENLGLSEEQDKLVESLESRKAESSHKDQLSKDNRIKECEIIDKIPSSSESSNEPRKRGRPNKNRSSKDESSEETKEEKVENLLDSSTESRKRDRTSIEKSAQEVSIGLEKEDKTKSSSDTPAVEIRKRGRPKAKSSKDATSEATEEELQLETDSSVELQSQGEKSKDTPSDESEMQDKNAEDIKDSTVDSEDKMKIKKKLPSPNRTWKVKKLNCADCGKWFSSAAALATHRLQHRTKKSGHLVHRCLKCKKLVPVDLYSKHLATVHGKTPSPGSKPMLRKSTTQGTHKQLVTKSLRIRRTLRSKN